MRTLITGASGLLGGHLITALQERRHDIHVLALVNEDTTRLEARGVTIHRGDITKPATLTPAMEGVDLVFHLAGLMGFWVPIENYRAVNVTGVENVCRAAVKAGVQRIVHISSWTVYGMNIGRPAEEDFPFQPFQEPYAITKTEGDVLVQKLIAEEGLPAVILRPGTFFGPGDRLHYGRMADRVRKGTGIVVGRGDNALPFCYVTDVVQGLMLAAEHPDAVGKAFNITNDEPITQEGFLRAIAEDLGAAAPRIHIPYDLLYTAAWGAEQVEAIIKTGKQPIVTRLGAKLFGTDNRHSIKRAREVLGFAPKTSLREGARLASEWYKQNLTATTTPAPVPVA
ncbi:MAG: NAD-dependent epimerase/dehydratase family protein [Chloroflexota bacterium]|nr:NAD-dependent epimerase/dehydratase family protein [Chloroflexota bacterium]